ncbi:MAG: DNA-packaging protein [Xanthobacteraceae bacterium]|nr:DNA-packaging protein [Xanthobacteraceae bacterium]
MSISAVRTQDFDLNPRQEAANELLASAARHILLRGGSRSGKTFLLCRAVIIRALMAPRSTHTIVRKHFNHLKHSVIYDTMPTVARLCFPGLKVALDKSDWFHELPNGSKIIYGGLDDAERTEKILGQEHATIYLNECSQISYGARNKLVTRLAQKAVVPATKKMLALKAYYDCNPPGKGHWTYSLFIKGVEPTSREKLRNSDLYGTMQLNPKDNEQNLPDGYMDELMSLPARDRLRFLKGEFQDQVDGALWDIDKIERIPEPANDRELRQLRDRMKLIVVAVDPSGASGPEDKKNDDIGLTVTGIDKNDRGVLLEDATGIMSPEQWGRTSVSLFDKWQADRIIGETNFGGDMVRAVIHGARKNVPFKKITASRGKHVRAEPVAALYERTPNRAPRIVHAGTFVDLEEEYANFSTAGYQGDRSPNRADAAIFGFTDLLLEQSKGKAGVW